MRKLYVSSDVLITPVERGWQVVPYARSFLKWASGQARTVVLTDRPLPEAIHLVSRLGCAGDVTVKAFDLNKTEHFSPGDDIYLVDDALIPGEVAWFTEHGLHDRIVAVGYNKGVSVETRDRLIELFNKDKRQ